MWSPWRSKYIGTFNDANAKSKEECFMCRAARKADPDEEALVVARKEHCFAVLNRYPYNNGHVLVAPYRHIGAFDELKPEEYTEIMALSQDIIKALKKIYNPHGFNFGANIGEHSGAGLPGHIHFHVVPRWGGDASFMATLADVKVVSIGIEETWKDLNRELNGGNK